MCSSRICRVLPPSIKLIGARVSRKIHDAPLTPFLMWIHFLVNFHGDRLRQRRLPEPAQRDAATVPTSYWTRRRLWAARLSFAILVRATHSGKQGPLLPAGILAATRAAGDIHTPPSWTDASYSIWHCWGLAQFLATHIARKVLQADCLRANAPLD